MQRELKVNFPPIAVSKGKEKPGMAPSRKITLALIFLGDCPNFLFIQLDGSCLLAVRKKQLPCSGFSCRGRRWTMRSSGFGCCTTKTLSPSRGGCSQEGSMSPSLMTVTPQPSTRPWLESHTVSKGASCPAHPKKQTLPEFTGRIVHWMSLRRHAGFSERNSFSELLCSLLGCKMLCTRTLGCYFEEIIKLRLQHFSRSLLPSKLKK